MTLKHTLQLLTQLEAEGKLVAKAQDVQTLYDPNHLIHLTVQATGADVREQFLAAVMAGDDAPDAKAEYEAALDDADEAGKELKKSLKKTASKKAANKK